MTTPNDKTELPETFEEWYDNYYPPGFTSVQNCEASRAAWTARDAEIARLREENEKLRAACQDRGEKTMTDDIRDKHDAEYMDELHQRQECGHGSLKRKCELCERDEEIATLKVRRQKAEISFYELRAKIEGRSTKAEAASAEMRETVEKVREHLKTILWNCAQWWSANKTAEAEMHAREALALLPKSEQQKEGK